MGSLRCTSQTSHDRSTCCSCCRLWQATQCHRRLRSCSSSHRSTIPTARRSCRESTSLSLTLRCIVARCCHTCSTSSHSWCRRRHRKHRLDDSRIVHLLSSRSLVATVGVDLGLAIQLVGKRIRSVQCLGIVRSRSFVVGQCIGSRRTAGDRRC